MGHTCQEQNGGGYRRTIKPGYDTADLYMEEPKVILAEEMRFDDARKRVGQPGFLHVINTEEIPGIRRYGWCFLKEIGKSLVRLLKSQ